jgi:hypothetical protein
MKQYLKWVAMAALALAPAAAAQSLDFIIEPDRGIGPDDYAKNLEGAQVQQQVQLIVPRVNALHLDVTQLIFDITALDGPGWADRVSGGVLPLYVQRPQDEINLTCVYTFGPDETGISDIYPDAVFPGGVGYEPIIGDYPNVRLTAPDGETLQEVTTYPPLLVQEGELVPGSKNYFVCFKTFELQMFSNGIDWNLNVSRADALDSQSIEHLYIQGNTCANWGDVTPFYPLPNGTNRDLIPDAFTYGPTGAQALTNPACALNKSWLDAIIVVAVKVNADRAGTNVADLTYTLTTTAWEEEEVILN